MVCDGLLGLNFLCVFVDAACFLTCRRNFRALAFLSVDKVWWESERSGTYPLDLEDECGSLKLVLSQNGGGGGKVVIGTRYMYYEYM